MFRQRFGPQDYLDSVVPLLLATGMRLAGIAAAFNQRCFEVQAATAADVVRDWVQLVLVAGRSVEGIFYEALPRGDAEPLGGRRQLPGRRLRSVVIGFPDRRVPVA
jgi:hypothetical protein